MADWAKIALKTALIAVIMASIWVVLNTITVPAIVLTQPMIDGIAFAKSFLIYWVPNFTAIWAFAIALIVFELVLIGAKIGLIAVKWLMKVNE